MSETLKTPQERVWAKLHVAFCLFFIFFYAYNPVNKYLWATMRQTYVLLAIPLAVGLYYYIRRLEGGLEQKLVTAYAVWYFLTRLMLGDIWFQGNMEADVVCELAVSSVILPVGSLLNGEGRRKVLNWLSLGLSMYFFPLGLVGIYTFFTRHSVYNPITEATIAGVSDTDNNIRINLTDLNPNISAFLFFLMFFLMVYQFFSCRKKLWRIPIVISAAVYYLLMGFTFSRSIMFTFSVCAAMLVVLLVLKVLAGRKKWVQALAIALVVVTVAPLGVKSFDVTAGLVSKAIVANMAEDSAQTAATSAGQTTTEELQPGSVEAPATATAMPEDAFTDHRDLGKAVSTLSGRDQIFKGAIYSAVEEPARLLRGALFDHVMDVANQHMKHSHYHYHNYLLQVYGLTGLPGFLLVLAFSVLIIIRMVQAYFSSDPRLGLPVKILTIILTGYFLYGMTEIPMFGFTDVRSYPFFLLAGIFLAYSYEVYPPKAGYRIKSMLHGGKKHGDG